MCRFRAPDRQGRLGARWSVAIGANEQPDVPSLRQVITVNHEYRERGRVVRLVTLLEVWSDGVVVRWVTLPPMPPPRTGDPRVPYDLRGLDVRAPFSDRPSVEDDAGTPYMKSGSGGASGLHGMDECMAFRPAPYREATVLRINWPEGETTIVPL
jgi:hypothetical protein